MPLFMLNSAASRPLSGLKAAFVIHPVVKLVFYYDYLPVEYSN